MHLCKERYSPPVLVGAICGMLSCYVVLKRWSLLGDAISHAVLPGVAIAYLLGWPFFVGAFITGALTSVGIGAIERNTRIKADAAMGLMFTASFALGVVIISKLASRTHLMHILFGNVLGVKHSALMLTFVASIIAILTVWLAYRPLLLYAFDPQQAQALGFNTQNYSLWPHSFADADDCCKPSDYGIILVVAMLITPGATAHLLTDRFTIMLLISVSIGILSAGLSGLWLSVVFNVASGGSIVLVAFAFFVLALLFSPKQGIVPRQWRHWKMG